MLLLRLGQVMNAQQDSFVNIEVGVVPTPAALRCNTLYDQITTEDDVEPYRCSEEIVPEKYEEDYGIYFKFIALKSIKKILRFPCFV